MTSSSRSDARAARVLVVDDSPEVRSLIDAYLRQSPHVLVFAEDGRGAIEKLMVDDFDVVLMDVQMPVMDGHSAAQTIRSLERTWDRPRTPIISMSACSAADVGEKSLEVGCDLHITKPFSRSRLLEILNSYSERRAFLAQ